MNGCYLFEQLYSRCYSLKMNSFTVTSAIRGYHVYKDIWDAASDINEELRCEREIGNPHDSFAVAVKKVDTIVGHVPRHISSICSIFIRRGGVITCKVTGSGRYSRDIPQGGMEVPCKLVFQSPAGSIEECRKAHKLICGLKTKSSVLDCTDTSEFSVTDTSESKVTSQSDEHDKVKVSQFEHEQLEAKHISNEAIEIVADTENYEEPPHKKVICAEQLIFGEKLSDLDINLAQRLLKAQFPQLQGLQSTLLQDNKITVSDKSVQNKLQIIHCKDRDHWVVGTTIGCDKDEMKIYDSYYCTIDRPTKVIIHNLFSASEALKIKVLRPQKQTGTQDCGLFAIAYATSIAHGHDLTKKFDQQRIRHHLSICFRNSVMTVFPQQ